MSLRSPISPAFASGEWSPELHHRSDLKRHQYACKQASNFIITRKGAAAKRPGSVKVCLAKNATARLIPFKRSLLNNFVIEMGDQYFRFCKNHLQVGFPAPYELAHPFTATQVDEVQFAQSIDVMYMAHGSVPPQVLSHLGDASWTIAPFARQKGPFKPINTFDTFKIKASAVVGSAVTLTSTGSLFDAGHVGGIWKLAVQDFASVGRWEALRDVAAGEVMRSNGKFYRAQLTIKTGNVAPDHVQGSAWDGRQGVTQNWLYLHSGFGLVRIDQVLSPTTAIANVLSRLPDDVTVGSGTAYWYASAWDAFEGYPSSVGFYDQRLVWAKKDTLYFSEVDAFNSYAPLDDNGVQTSASAFNIRLTTDGASSVLWIRQNGRHLVVGMTDGEKVVGPSPASGKPFGPDNYQVHQSTEHGSAPLIDPVKMGRALIFVDKTGKRVFEAKSSDEGLETRDLAVLADHLLDTRAFEQASQVVPEPIVWFITQTGQLRGLTYEDQEDVVAWHRHFTAGKDAFIESICVIPDPPALADELWWLVSRTVNNATVRTIEYLSFSTWKGAVKDRVFLDGAVMQNGALTDTIGGLDHLESELVDVLFDGRWQSGKKVTAGIAKLSETGATLIAGLPIVSVTEPVWPDPGTPEGHTQGKKVTTLRAQVLLSDSWGGDIAQADVGTFYDIEYPNADASMDSQPAMFSGAVDVPIEGTAAFAPTVQVRSSTPWAFNLVGLGYDQQIQSKS